MTSHEIVLDMIVKFNNPDPLKVALAEALRLAQTRMSDGDFETLCDGVVDAVFADAEQD